LRCRHRITFRLTPDARAKSQAMAPFLTSKVAKRWQFGTAAALLADQAVLERTLGVRRA
jgi:hypothetical protein